MPLGRLSVLLLLAAAACSTDTGTDTAPVDSGDSGGDSGSPVDSGDSGDTAAAGTAPVITFTAPTSDGTYAAGGAVEVAATVVDAEDAPGTLTLAWTDESGAAVAVDATMDDQGAVTGTSTWTEGAHTLTLTATDPAGHVGTGSVSFTVGPENVAPECEILSPPEGTVLDSGDAVAFSGQVVDPDGTVPPTARWSTETGLAFASGSVDADGRSDVLVNLDYGAHTITMRGKDLAGATCEASVDVVIAQPPDVTILAPADGDVFNEGESITFLATATDDTTPPEALVVQWKDDDGTVLDESGVAADGTLTFDTAALAAGDHTVTLKVTDADGARTKVTVDLTVNGLPGAPGITLSPSDPTTDDDLTVAISTNSVDPERDRLTYTYAWTVDGAASATTGKTVSAADTTKGQVWSVTVTPNDGYGDGDSAVASVTIADSAPSVASATLSPDPATIADTFTCTAGATSDADGDAVSLTYGWTVNGSTVPVTTNTLDNAWWSPGDTVVCTVTPDDGEQDGAMVTSNAVTVDNGAPSITGVTVSPDPAIVTDTLTCASTGFRDPEGDAEATTYAWTVNGAAAGTGPTLAGAFAAGDTVTCTGTPSDGVTAGAARSASVVIADAAPVLAAVTLSPSAPRVADTLTCTPGATTDADGTTSFTYTYAWTVNGSAVSATTATLAAPSFVKGDVVSCSARPDDGTTAGDWVASSSVTIGNTAPTVSGVSLSPTLVYTDDTITASATGADVDAADTVTLRYAWSVNGSLVAPTGSTLAGTYFSRGDSVTVTVTPDDGTDTGTAISSPARTISNTVPTTPTVTAAPDSPEPGVDDVTCTVTTVSTDADADAITYAFSWTQNGAAFTGATDTATTSTVDAADVGDGDVFVCTVMPSDGTSTGAAAFDTVTALGAEYTIGSYTAFASISGGEPTGYVFAQKATVAVDALLYDLGKYTGTANGSEWTMAIYTDSGGAPSTLVAETSTTVAAAAYQELEVTGAPVSLPAGDYWIAWQCSVASCKDHFSTGAADGAPTNTVYYSTYSAYPAWPSTWPSATAHNTGKIYNVYGVVR